MNMVLLAIMIPMFIGCGSSGADGKDGAVVEVPAEISEGLENGLVCLEAALPDFYLKSVSIKSEKQEIHIKLKETDYE